MFLRPNLNLFVLLALSRLFSEYYFSTRKCKESSILSLSLFLSLFQLVKSPEERNKLRNNISGVIEKLISIIVCAKEIVWKNVKELIGGTLDHLIANLAQIRRTYLVLNKTLTSFYYDGLD